jgi:hypothetical protein
MPDQPRVLKGLLVAYYFPPLNSIASHRTYSFAKYLNEGRNSLDIICPKWEDDLNLNSSNYTAYYTSIRKPDINFGQQKVLGLSKIRQQIFNKYLKINFFRERHPSFFYKEVIEVLKKINLNDYDYLITSYGPLDSIHIGNYIKSVNPGITWIIDYRDLYSQNDYYKMGFARPFFNRFEKKITASADAFITVSNVLKNTLEKLLKKPGKVIYNGYDDYSTSVDSDFENEIKKSELPIISYAGSLYQGERDVRPFLEYFKKNKLDERFSLFFALINDFDEVYLREIMSKINLKNVVIRRNLSFGQSIALQNRSSILLMLANFNGKGNGFLTGKIFEYFAAQKPVVYSGTTTSDYELYRLIIDYKIGESFDKFAWNEPEKYIALDNTVFHRKFQALQLKRFINEIIETNKV